MIYAVIFDCFGVLAEDGWAPFKRRYLENNPELLAKVSQVGRQVDAGERRYDDMISETAKLVGVDERMVRGAVERKVPNEELFAYIKQELKPHYKIGMLSNASYDVLGELFTPEQTALFDATALSHEMGLVKPDPAMYQAIAKRLNVEPCECILVDDKKGHVEGAKSIGMQAVIYTTVPQLKVELSKKLERR